MRMLFGLGALVLALAAQPASATLYFDFRYDYRFGSGDVTGYAVGQFLTSDTTTDVDGRQAYTITGITGTRVESDGITFAIGGLQAPGVFDDYGDVSDNRLFMDGGSYLDFYGLVFSNYENEYEHGVVTFNLYYASASGAYVEYGSDTVLSNMTVTPATGPASENPPEDPVATPVPEPAGWAGTLGGLAALGAAGRRRRVVAF